MPEVTDTPPSFVAAPGSPPPKEHWKAREKRLREEAEAAAKVVPVPAPAPAVVIEPPALAPKMPEMPVGGWPGDTPPTVTGPSIEPASVVPAVPIPSYRALDFGTFAERYFMSNQIRPEAYTSPKAIRSMAADCVAAYHAYIYVVGMGFGCKVRSGEAAKFGGVHTLANDVQASVALMDRAMDGR